MARLKKGGIPSLRRHKASGRAVVTLSGQDFYCGMWGKWGPTKSALAEYDRQVQLWIGRGRVRLGDESGGEMTVCELVIQYVRFAQVYYRKNGRVTNEVTTIKRALKVVRRLFGREPINQFRPKKLRQVQEEMIRLGWTRKQINKQVLRVRRMFKWAAAQEYFPGSLLESLRALEELKAGRTAAPESAPVLPVDEATIEATLPHLPPIVADMVRLQRLTGCRPDEVMRLRPCDVDRSAEVWAYRPASHKTEHHGRERVVFIGPKGQELLEPYLDRDAEAFCFSPAETERQRRQAAHARRETPLSCGNRPGSNRRAVPERPAGERYTSHSYGRAITRAARKAGLPHWAPNQLRHSAATEIRKRFGLEAVQVTLGHSKADVSQIYAERDLEKAASVMAELG